MGHHTPLLKKGTGIAIEILNIKYENSTELANIFGCWNVIISVFLLNEQLSQKCMEVSIHFGVNYV